MNCDVPHLKKNLLLANFSTEQNTRLFATIYYDASHIGDTGSMLGHDHYTSKLGQAGLKDRCLGTLWPTDQRSLRGFHICAPGRSQNICAYI